MIKIFEWGKITVDDNQYIKDLKIYPDGIMSNWWRDEGHLLQPQDIPELKNKGLEHVVIGCGVHGVLKVSPEAIQLFDDLDLSWSTLKTPDAVKEFNKYLSGPLKKNKLLYTALKDIDKVLDGDVTKIDSYKGLLEAKKVEFKEYLKNQIQRRLKRYIPKNIPLPLNF